MPTISGAILKATAFQATGGPSLFQDVIVTTWTVGSGGYDTTLSHDASNAKILGNSAVRGLVLGTNGLPAITIFGADQAVTFATSWTVGAAGYDTTLTHDGSNAKILGNSSLRGMVLGTNGTPAITIAGSNQAVTFANSITTAAPTGGAGAWKLGIANVVSPTAPNRTVAIDIGGTTYYLAAKTTNN